MAKVNPDLAFSTPNFSTTQGTKWQCRLEQKCCKPQKHFWGVFSQTVERMHMWVFEIQGLNNLAHPSLGSHWWHRFLCRGRDVKPKKDPSDVCLQESSISSPKVDEGLGCYWALFLPTPKTITIPSSGRGWPLNRKDKQLEGGKEHMEGCTEPEYPSRGSGLLSNMG